MALLSLSEFSLAFSAVGWPKTIKDISFSIAPGEFLALVGESGSGKSLTALSCLGLQPHDAQVSGSITFDGQEIIGASGKTLRAIRGKKIGMIFQEPMTALNPLHTIGKQISEMWRYGDVEMWGKGKNLHIPISPHPHIQSLLNQVGLSHLKNRLNAYPHQLSGGERQRVMIAMAIANSPALLIADEPTTAVDVTIQAQLLKLIKQLQRERHMAVLFITHDLTIVRRLADRVAVMSKGEIVEQGAVAEVFNTPKHPYTRHLLASEPKGFPLPYPADAKAIIESENLKVWFSIKKGFLQRSTEAIKAVDGISLRIPEQSTLGVVGESGSGKTTLGFALLKLIKSEGKIVFLGKDISRLRASMLRPLRQKMQLVFQDPYASLNPRMTIGQIIEEGLLVHFPGQSPAARAAAIDGMLHDVGLSSDLKGRYPHEFSGGQRQRVSIARAMVLKPSFVVLDEPTSALDLSVQAQIIELLKGLQQKFGLTMLFISHDLRVVKAIAHRIAVMHKGRIVEEGITADIFARPQNAYTRTLIDAAFMRG